MRRALELARRGEEAVSPNPMVGAVIVRSGRVLGEGYHARCGGPHAEVEAIRAAGSCRGADLHVTLEPCAHQGKTPPCTTAILRAGIARVIYGAGDPNPRTSGIGPRLLRRAGVEVKAGCLRRECEALNAPFLHWMRTGLPWGILKWAMTLDGRIATAAGESRWITGPAARRHAHGLRRRADAILVGTETARRDDPLLTPRPSLGRAPLRVILDRAGRLPLGLRLLAPAAAAGPGRRWLVTTSRCPRRRRRQLEERGVEIVVACESRGQLELRAVFEALAASGIAQILIEGGAALAAGCLREGLVQEVYAYIAPRILGERGSRPAVDGTDWHDLEATRWLGPLAAQPLGGDWVLHGRVRG